MVPLRQLDCEVRDTLWCPGIYPSAEEGVLSYRDVEGILGVEGM